MSKERIGPEEGGARSTLAVLGCSAGDRDAAPAGTMQTDLAGAATADVILALYRAPWVAFLEDQDRDGQDGAAQWLDDWIHFHRGVLELQHRLPARVLLVNAAHLGDGESLIAHLQELGVPCESRDGDGQGDKRAMDGPESAGPALQSLLAAGMAHSCPEAWSTYEELESRALLLGREPEFRGADGIADVTNPGALLAGFAALRNAIRHDRDASKLVQPAVDPAFEALRRENELLGLHLEQVLEELHFHNESGKHFRRRLLEAGEIAEAARIVISDLRAGEQAPG